ncbi:unnamed protein product [Clavelina lepadiformis]|uniref:SH3 domain-binding protein 5 n=1 Tax=Clavelina lepadiformis TaxID=159417 RepID=A0ABP0FX16_CLALP
MTNKVENGDDFRREEHDENDEDDAVDPRVKGELDKLNQATDEINKLENEISDERIKFRQLLNDSTHQLAILGHKYGQKTIERARPYYDALKEMQQAQAALQRAVHNFQSSNGIHRAAKETIALAEQKLSEVQQDQKVDMTWQEVLNLQTRRFNEAEANRTRSKRIHDQATRRYVFLDKKCKKIKSRHKRSTAKTKSYFESKEKLELKLQKQRQRVEDLRKRIDEAKGKYRNALSNLEIISTEIHEQRQINSRMITLLGDREEGEGSEGLVETDGLDHTAAQFDLVGPKSYDDLEELEQDLNRFSFNDEESEDEFSESSSEEGSISSIGATSQPTSPRTKRRSVRRMRSYKRQMSLPNPTLGNDMNDQGDLTKSRVRRKLTPPTLESCLVEEDTVFDDQLTEHKRTGGQKSMSGTASNDASPDATYVNLHGVSKQHCGMSPNNNVHDSDEYDIFDDLCT